MDKLGLEMAISKTASTLEEAKVIATDLIGGFPIIVRPAYTLGGTGGGIAYNQAEFERIVLGGLDASMTSQVRNSWPCAQTLHLKKLASTSSLRQQQLCGASVYICSRAPPRKQYRQLATPALTAS